MTSKKTLYITVNALHVIFVNNETISDYCFLLEYCLTKCSGRHHIREILMDRPPSYQFTLMIFLLIGIPCVLMEECTLAGHCKSHETCCEAPAGKTKYSFAGSLLRWHRREGNCYHRKSGKFEYSYLTLGTGICHDELIECYYGTDCCIGLECKILPKKGYRCLGKRNTAGTKYPEIPNRVPYSYLPDE